MKILLSSFSAYIEHRYKIVSWLILTAIIATLVFGFGWWLTHDPTTRFLVFIPGMDGAPPVLEIRDDTVRIGEFSRIFGVIPIALPGSWTRFRGAEADNISKEPIDLVEYWGEEGPDMLWSVELGEGHAAPAVFNGRVYILDYDEERKADSLRCFSLDDGSEVWRRWYNVFVKRNHGMSRTVPAVNEKYVVTIGPRCHVMCVDSESGTLKWGLDLEKDFGTKVPLWYTAQCPLLDGDTAVIAPSGDETLMMGIDCETGSILWKTPNLHGWKMSHSSIMPMSLNGKDMYVYSAIGGVAGISAEEGNRGKLLWETSAWKPTVVAPSPVVFEDGRIFLTAGYGSGSMMLSVKERDGNYTVEVEYELRPNEGLASEQQTPVLYKGFLFGVLPKDAGKLRNQFMCFHPDGEIIWTSGETNRFGLGPYLVADDKFFILGDDGVLTVAQASTEEYLPLTRANVLDGRDPWGPLAIAGGRMLFRDSERMMCIDVAGNE